MTIKNTLASIIIALTLSGCSTMMNGDTVEVPVTTTPSGATLVLNGESYISPAVVLVPRGEGDFNLHIEKKGFQAVDILLKESIDGWFWGNFLFGGVVGFAVDFITGDAFDIEPELIEEALNGVDVSRSPDGSLQFILVDINKLPQQLVQRIKNKSNKILKSTIVN